MEEAMKRKTKHNIENIADQRYKDADSFAKKVLKKHEGMISSTLIKKPSAAGESIELLFIIDDLNNVVFDQQVAEIKMSTAEEAYSKTLPMKCEVMLASAFWEGFMARDLETIQIVRESLVMQDNGFFLPIQDLLATGKIRPSKESVQVYFVKAERSMKTANQHIGKAMIDLYWAVTDAAHAAVMVAGITPPSPAHLAEIVRKELVLRNLVHKRCGDIVEQMYDAAKRIMHRERFEISGKEFDEYLADADFFIKEINEFVEEHAKR
jgi:uncharacterized protein (UPF0332 family)